MTAPPLVILSEPVRSTAGLHIFTLVERTGSDRLYVCLVEIGIEFQSQKTSSEELFLSDEFNK